jgi:hypothetical protein
MENYKRRVDHTAYKLENTWEDMQTTNAEMTFRIFGDFDEEFFK